MEETKSTELGRKQSTTGVIVIFFYFLNCGKPAFFVAKQHATCSEKCQGGYHLLNERKICERFLRDKL